MKVKTMNIIDAAYRKAEFSCYNGFIWYEPENGRVLSSQDLRALADELDRRNSLLEKSGDIRKQAAQHTPCEICGKPSSVLVNDVSAQISAFGDVERVTPFGVHHFCKDHARKATLKRDIEEDHSLMMHSEQP
jgi:hypothetical protein